MGDDDEEEGEDDGRGAAGRGWRDAHCDSGACGASRTKMRKHQQLWGCTGRGVSPVVDDLKDLSVSL